MYPDPRTSPNPHLTQPALRCLISGLGLSAEARACLTRACRKISKTHQRGTTRTAFSTYCTGAAPTFTGLCRILDDELHPARGLLTREEIRACRTFIALREAVGVLPASQFERSVPRNRPPLHNFGPMRPTPSVPSGRWR